MSQEGKFRNRHQHREKLRERCCFDKSRVLGLLTVSSERGVYSPELSDTLILGFWPFGYEAIEFCCLSNSVCGTFTAILANTHKGWKGKHRVSAGDGAFVLRTFFLQPCVALYDLSCEPHSWRIPCVHICPPCGYGHSSPGYSGASVALSTYPPGLGGLQVFETVPVR